jgi:hypothetical protein
MKWNYFLFLKGITSKKKFPLGTSQGGRIDFIVKPPAQEYLTFGLNSSTRSRRRLRIGQ